MFERLFCYIVNSILCLLYRGEYRKHLKIGSVRKIQEKLLLGIVGKNKDTVYGRKYNFKRVLDTGRFQADLPLTVYDDYLGPINRLIEDGVNELYSEPTILLEITSGSTSSSKLIPYNKSLKSEFQKGIKPWLYSLYSKYKGIKRGKSYWSITPAAVQEAYTKSGIPIGFEEDSAYFGRLEKRFIDRVLAVPARIAKLQNMEEFYFETAYHLLKCKNLTLISVWNPTYLILLLDYMASHKGSLASKIYKKDKKRARFVGSALKERKFRKLWKDLKVISCWADGNAGAYAKKLGVLFPGVVIQPKGLIATEGFVSFPFEGNKGARLSVYSHFFEFESTGDDKSIYLAHELKKGSEYTVIITTSGGLYRYRLNDIVKVMDMKKDLPILKFMGKADNTSDLFGEKLSEAFLRETFDSLGMKADFYMVAPQTDHYVLYIKSANIPKGVDEALRKSFHYDYCRKLGQLKPLKIFKLYGDPEKEYIQACIAGGQRLGDIKPAILYSRKDLAWSFKGEYV